MIPPPRLDDLCCHCFRQLESREFISDICLGEPVERRESQIVRDVCGDVEAACELVESEGGHSRNEAPRNVIVAGGLDLAEELGVHVLHPLKRISISTFGNLEGRNKERVAKSFVDVVLEKLSEPVVARIVESWRYNHNGYLFDPPLQSNAGAPRAESAGTGS